MSLRRFGEGENRANTWPDEPFHRELFNATERLVEEAPSIEQMDQVESDDRSVREAQIEGAEARGSKPPPRKERPVAQSAFRHHRSEAVRDEPPPGTEGEKTSAQAAPTDGVEDDIDTGGHPGALGPDVVPRRDDDLRGARRTRGLALGFRADSADDGRPDRAA